MVSIYRPIFAITIDGDDLDDLKDTVLEIRVEEEINLPTMFTIRFSNLDRWVTGSYRGLDLSSLVPGGVVSIALGLNSAEDLLSGEITAVNAVFAGRSYVEVQGYDLMHRLRFGTQRTSFTESTDSDIVSSIAGGLGMSVDVSDAEATTVYSHVFQHNQSNYAFLLQRAQRIGHELLYDSLNDTLIFRKSQESDTADLEEPYTYGGGILERFQVQLNTLTQGSEVEVRGWDMTTATAITATATSGSENSTMGGSESGFDYSTSAISSSETAIIDQSVQDSDEAAVIAKARYNRNLKYFITGEGFLRRGDTNVRAGNNIEIDGLADTFNGVYYIVSTVHTFTPDKYTTSFKVRKTGI